MKKLVTAFSLFLSLSLSAQTIFYYGDDSVPAKEFLKAYNKNKTGAKSEKAFREYLDLYIASRLKIKEAKARGYDTLPQMIADLDNLRQQILPAYLTDREGLDKLVEEAFNRSQKDIHLAHIFISFKQNGIVDSAAALKKLAQAQEKLKKGASFASVAKEYSDDPSAKENGGDLNWITVFNLPYELENLAYNTSAGRISAVYKSNAGYHIFKNLGERKDPGRVKAAQILIAFPPAADEATRLSQKKLADSIYSRLLKGDDFGKLALQFSNDVLSGPAQGEMQEFGVGQYDPEFENKVLGLKKGAITKPFLTSHGYHIVKLLSVDPPVKKTDDRAMATLRSKVEQSDRINTTKAALASRVLQDAGFRKANFNEADLWLFSDSLISYRTAGRTLHINAESDLMRIGDKQYKVSDWITYAQTFRYRPDGSGIKPYPELWNEFVQAKALEYYQDNLEKYNSEFRDQLNEFRDGNLFFEIMQREVWGPAQTDSAALASYYEKHRTRYQWKPGADAVIFYANDLNTANDFSNVLKKDPSSWHSLVSDYEEKIAADSSRFEMDQIPNGSKQRVQPGVITTPVLNKADNTASFAYIIRDHDQTEPRGFADAKGLVINDYQSELEQRWVDALKKKYPVRINEQVLSDLIKRKEY